MNDTEETGRLSQALQDAQRRLQAVVEVSGAQLGTLEFDLHPDGGLVFVRADEVAHRLITVAHEGFYGKRLTEVFTGLGTTDIPAELEETACSGRAMPARTFVPAGTRLGRVFSLFAFQSAPDRVVVKFWVSTDLPETQEIARRNQELLKLIFGESPVAIALTREADGSIIDVNAEWSRLTGYARAEALGHTTVELRCWPDAASRVQALAPLRTQDTVPGVRMAALTRDGRHVTFTLNCARIRIGGVDHLLTYVLDITAEEAAKQALADQLEFIRRITDQVPGLLYMLRRRPDGSLCMPFVSQGIRDMFGVEPEAVRDSVEPLLAHGHPDDLPGTLASNEASARKLTPWHHEFRLRAGADGADRWVLVNALPHREPDGSVVWHGALTDITQRKLAENTLRSLNAELEARVQRRTAELARARDLAESANRSKSEFLSGMSHELRTPMNAILGFGQLLEIDPGHPLPPRQRGYVKEILRAGSHLLELINEVLDLARIEAGKLQISLEPVHVKPLIDDCLALVQPVAQEHGIGLVAAAPQDCDCYVLADRTRAKQVLLNLLSNAIKYNREGGNVQIGCKADSDSVRIDVSDTGQGLGPEHRERLFHDFERLDADRGPIEGAGIGLALSKRLVTMMQGEIGVDSEVGKGSTFWFRLKRTERVGPLAAEAAADASTPQPAAAGGRTVLYIEDNPANVLLMEEVFARLSGVRLICAPSPGLGLDIARAERPDLILLDIQMPGMDGYEVLRRLRNGGTTGTIPVIAISANAMHGDIERGLAAGFTDYVTKPLDVRRLLAAVELALRH